MKKVKIVYVNEISEKLGLNQEYILADGFVEFTNVESFIPFVKDGKGYPYTELYFKSGSSLVVGLTLEEVEGIINNPSFDKWDLWEAFNSGRDLEEYDDFSMALWFKKYKELGYKTWHFKE